MNNTQHTKLASIIQDQKLKLLIDQANRIENANIHLKRFLPPLLSEHVIVSNIKGKTLILQTNSPAWSTRTNFIATEIVNYMRNEGGLAMVERLKVKVVPIKIQSDNITRSIKPLSKTTAELLQSVASDLKDEGLSNILTRISRHYNNKREE